MNNDNTSNKRVRITLLLSDETLSELRAFAYENLGTTNVSKAVMLMVKQNNERTRREKETA